MKKLKSSKVIIETPAPPQCRVLTMEIESYYRKIQELEVKDYRSDDLQVYKAEILMRLDLYRLSSGNIYERIPDIAKGDKNASIKIFNELNGHSWKEKFGWIGQGKTTVRPEIPMFEAEGSLYDGLQVSERRVTGLVLTNNGCEGQLSDRIGDFAALNTLYLDYNNIEGKIPRGLGRLELLEYINLSGNCFIGELEERSLTKLTTLRILNLSFNQLSGTLPDCFDCITKLQELNLSGNQFNGILPSTMSTCVNLRHLQLYSNQFTGIVPEWLGNFTNLISINLSQNKFSGGINQLFNCIKLRKIQLTSNELTLPLSPSISKLTNLSLLYLHHNLIHGKIPETICSMNSLQFLNLSYNEFSGTLPSNIGNLYKLKVLVLSNTQLVGPLPDSISKLTNLSDFHIFTSSNSETMSLSRGFQKDIFNRVYCWGTKVGLDNVTWNEPKVNDLEDIFNNKEKKQKKKKKGNQLRFEDSDDEEEDVLERLRRIHEEGIELDEQSK